MSKAKLRVCFQELSCGFVCFISLFLLTSQKSGFSFASELFVRSSLRCLSPKDNYSIEGTRSDVSSF